MTGAVAHVWLFGDKDYTVKEKALELAGNHKLTPSEIIPRGYPFR